MMTGKSRQIMMLDRRGLARAAFASGGVEVVTRALTMALSIAIARVLEPREVGLLGLAVIIIGVMSLIAACAETAGIVSRSKGSDGEYALAAVGIRGTITAGCLCVLHVAFPSVMTLVAGREVVGGELMALMRVLAWQLVAEGAASYPRVVLQRRLKLTSVAGAVLSQGLCHVSLSMALLWMGYGAIGVAWAAVVGASSAAAFLWWQLLACKEPRSESAGRAGLWWQTTTSAGRVFTASFLGYLNGRLDNLLVAGVLGATAMSFYGLAWSASRVPLWILGQALGLVLVPTLVHVRDDAGRTQRVLQESLRHSYLLLVPACALLFVTAESLVDLVLGRKWLPLVPALRIMTVSVLMGPVVIVSGAILTAKDRAHLAGLATGAQFVTLMLLIVPLTRRWGVSGAALGDLASTTVLTTALFFFSWRVGSNCAVISSALVPLLAGTLGGFLVANVGEWLPMGMERLVVETGALLCAYGVAVWLLGGRDRLVELSALTRAIVGGRPGGIVATMDASDPGGGQGQARAASGLPRIAGREIET